MADICNRCGRMILIPFNKEVEEKSNGRIVTLHKDCGLDDWSAWEQNELDRMKD